MFSLAAKRRIRVDGITQLDREKREIIYDKVRTGGVGNQLHLLEWQARMESKGRGGNDITSWKRK